VLTQVKFSRTPALVSDEGEERLAERLVDFPVRRQGMSVTITVTPPGSPEQRTIPTRVFADPTETWVVTVTEQALSLETTEYVSRDDFCRRARLVFDAVADTALPPIVDRVGLRYVDRLSDATDLESLDTYVNPRLRVLLGAVDPAIEVEHSVSESVIRLSTDERLHVRGGILPPDALLDPLLMPLSVRSWVLDLDIYTVSGGFPFDPVALHDRLSRYGDHVHSFFRWAMTPEFIDAFSTKAADVGGRP